MLVMLSYWLKGTTRAPQAQNRLSMDKFQMKKPNSLFNQAKIKSWPPVQARIRFYSSSLSHVETQ